MNQRELISLVSQNRRVPFNPVLFRRSDEDIMVELQKVILSCQRENKYFTIKVAGFTVVDDYAEINDILFRYYENAYRNKTKMKKKDNQYGYINLNESDIRLLLVDYHIEAPFAVDEHERVDDFRVIIAVPRIVDKYYFRINGIMRSTLYQIVDGSTYNNNNSNAKIRNITFKIVFMAARVFQYHLDIMDIDGELHSLAHFMSNIFSKTTSALKYVFARFGFYEALNFMGIPYIQVLREPDNNPDNYCFRRHDNLYVTVPKYLLDHDTVVQSAVACIYQSLVPGMKYELVFDPLFWVRSLGGDFNNTSKDNMLCVLDPKDNTVHDTLEKGFSVLDSFETIYDISTKESLRLPEEDKATMYHVIRWLVREFRALTQKDNLDVSIKKIRFAEYIASLYAMKVAKGIYRVADHNAKITTMSIKRAIRTDPMYLLNAVSKSNLVNYRNMVSDMDGLLALKFTYKGIAGLGESDNNSIPEICRHTHPSHLGRLDLDNSSDTNPGITGTIVPFTTMYDGYFSDYHEPNSWNERFLQVMDDYRRVSSLKDAIVFKNQLLGIESTENDEESEVINLQVCAAMEDLMRPHMYSGEGEIIMNPYIELEI